MLGEVDLQTLGRLSVLEGAFCARGHDLALYLVFDRPNRLEERPGLARTYFAQRCVSDAQLERIAGAVRSIGGYVELFDGDRALLEALASGRLHEIDRGVKVIYNGIEGGVGEGGFAPGRKALIPAVADSYGICSSNSNAYACALGRHKFHYFSVLRHLGLQVPPTWHYRPGRGWAGGAAPPPGARVIAKSTYESWSVGVRESSVFVVDSTCEARVAAIADEIGQPVTVQEFIAGPEVCVSVLACPEAMVAPPIEAVLTKAPGDPSAITTVDDNLQKGAVTRRRFDGSPDLLEQIRGSALTAFDILELEAFARIDFRVDGEGHAWLTDVGVSPGLGEGNSAFAAVQELGFDYPQFLRIVIATTLASRGLL